MCQINQSEMSLPGLSCAFADRIPPTCISLKDKLRKYRERRDADDGTSERENQADIDKGTQEPQTQHPFE